MEAMGQDEVAHRNDDLSGRIHGGESDSSGELKAALKRLE